MLTFKPMNYMLAVTVKDRLLYVAPFIIAAEDIREAVYALLDSIPREEATVLFTITPDDKKAYLEGTKDVLDCVRCEIEDAHKAYGMGAPSDEGHIGSFVKAGARITVFAMHAVTAPAKVTYR